jgi:hypothetical protein
VSFRHKLFNRVVDTNKETISVMLGVGGGGKDSLATFIRSHGITECTSANNMASCRAPGVPEKIGKALGTQNAVLVIGVPHPGGAGKGASIEGLRSDFEKAMLAVKDYAQKHSGWGQTGSADRINVKSSTYKYDDSVIPFRDFTFGNQWGSGSGGTRSNRSKPDSILIFSDGGKYASGNDAPKPEDIMSGLTKASSGPYRGQVRVPGMLDTDVPYESPRSDVDPRHVEFDAGPGGLAINFKLCDRRGNLDADHAG